MFCIRLPESVYLIDQRIYDIFTILSSELNLAEHKRHYAEKNYYAV